MEDQIISFFSIIEKQVQTMEYGTMTINVIVSNGLPVTKSLNIVKSKRIRYKIDNYPEK